MEFVKAFLVGGVICALVQLCLLYTSHWQDYSALSEQVREYYQENHKEVV